MTQSEEARLAVVERRMDDVCNAVSRMEGKLDDALVNKADWGAVDDLRKEVKDKADAADVTALQGLITKLIIAVAGFAITTLVGLVVMAVFGR